MTSFGKLQRHQARTAYLFITPTMFLFIVFSVIPVIMAFYLSFTNYDVLSRMEWVGWDNYRRLWEDSLYWMTFRNVGYYALLFVPLNLAISVGLALLLN